MITPSEYKERAGTVDASIELAARPRDRGARRRQAQRPAGSVDVKLLGQRTALSACCTSTVPPAGSELISDSRDGDYVELEAP
jgi:hypothetical protein